MNSFPQSTSHNTWRGRSTWERRSEEWRGKRLRRAERAVSDCFGCILLINPIAASISLSLSFIFLPFHLSPSEQIKNPKYKQTNDKARGDKRLPLPRNSLKQWKEKGMKIERERNKAPLFDPEFPRGAHGNSISINRIFISPAN
uniref:Putative F-actin-capping protein subunit beta n=1 Tax=Rhizophora mucronata TaxID=61149 RepID=A0A2P2JHP3_RHIMU